MGKTNEKKWIVLINRLLEYNAAGTVTARYTHGPGIDEPFAMEKNSQTYYYHADALGSIIALSSQTGALVQSYDYDSFGSIKTQTGTVSQPYAYTAREWDPEKGTYHYRARDYDPKAGRFLQKDPIGFKAGDVNLFRYVGNNVPNYTDPSGLWAKGIHMAITQQALNRVGCQNSELPRSVAAVDSLPGSQSPENAYLHAMVNGYNPPAKWNRDKQKFYDLIEKGGNSCSESYLALALHALQDSFAPAHSSFKPWFGFNILDHIKTDAFWTSGANDAVVASEQVLKKLKEKCSCLCK